MTRPLIAITPYYDDQKKRYFLSRKIFNCIIDNGGSPLTLPFVEEFKEEYFEVILDRVDGILFTGGHDFPASYYGEENSSELSTFAPPRDQLEFGLMPMALKRNIPVLGICRGMQIMNVVLGGSLYQHIDCEKQQCLLHNVRDLPSYECVHKVMVRDKDIHTNFFGYNDLDVNSLHHQAVKDIGKGLKELLWSEDGFVEALYGPEYRYLVGVQWHPEYLYKTDPANKRLFESFMEAAIEYRKEIEKKRRKTIETI